MNGLDDVTVVIPFREGGNEHWLLEAQRSLPAGVPLIVARNRGNLHGALNQALRDAQTEFVFRLDADDLAVPGLLERLLQPSWNADVVYPSMVVTDAQLQPIGDHHAAPFSGLRLLDMNYIAGSALVRRSTALKAGGYRKLAVLEDWDLWVRMYRAGARFKACPEAQILYRRHEGSRNDEVAGDLEQLARWRERIVLRAPARIPFRTRRLPDPLLEAQATFYNAATPATTYLRCTLPARHLPAIVRPDLAITETESALAFAEHHGKAAVFQLAADKFTAFGVVAMRAHGIRVLVETDDNYLASPGKQIRDRQQWGKRIGDGPAHSAQGHQWIAAQADGVIVTTDYLARQYRKINPNVYVARNSIDPADWPAAPEKPDDGVLRILWAASLSHQDDIALVTRAFEWASAQPDVEVYVTGLNPRWKFPYRQLPWLDDLDAYRAHFQHFDVGVAPIKQTPFALGRSDIKALEYAMGGCAPVLSDIAPYGDWVDGENCLKASDAKGFLRTLQQLVRDRDQVKQLAAAARGYTLAERTIQRELHVWQEAIDG